LTATTFTGCASTGTGTMATGNEVNLGYMLRVTGSGDAASPLNLISNVFGGPCDVTVQKRVITSGNHFNYNFYISGGSAYLYPTGDTFDAGKTFLPVGAASKVGVPLWLGGDTGTAYPTVLSAAAGVPAIAGNVGDMCINRATGAAYRCTVAGAAGAATWTTP
ncbi:MAG: hypothetical protein M3N98_03580, partial [Actinomycetota bacterium]|nr:hypothetical protein [Actinomycetota bacterium]